MGVVVGRVTARREVGGNFFPIAVTSNNVVDVKTARKVGEDLVLLPMAARKVEVVLFPFLLPRAVTSHNNSAARSWMTETAAGGMGWRRDLAWKVGGARKVGGVLATNVGATRKKVRHHMAPTTNGDFLEIAAALGDDTAVTAGGGSPFGTVGRKGHGETRSRDNGGRRK
jgi:hypothetical protein